MEKYSRTSDFSLPSFCISAEVELRAVCLCKDEAVVTSKGCRISLMRRVPSVDRSFKGKTKQPLNTLLAHENVENLAEGGNEFRISLVLPASDLH